MKAPSSNKPEHEVTAQRRRRLRLIAGRAVWLGFSLFCVGALLAFAAVASFPRAGASEPLSGAAAFQESCGIAIMRVTHYPFWWLCHLVGTGGTEILVCSFWAAVCYTPFALLRWPYWVFRRGERLRLK